VRRFADTPQPCWHLLDSSKLFVWLVSDHFRAASIFEWHPGWAQDSADFAAPFSELASCDFGSSTAFGLLLQKHGTASSHLSFNLATNFGLWIPLALALWDCAAGVSGRLGGVGVTDLQRHRLCSTRHCDLRRWLFCETAPGIGTTSS